MNIEIGPNLLAAAPWIFLGASAIAVAIAAIVHILCDHANWIANAIAVIIDAWRGK